MADKRKDVPFSEPPYLKGFSSPYYTPAHHEFQKRMRQFVDAEIRPYVSKWEEDYAATGAEMPLDVFRKAHVQGLFSPWAPAELGGTPPAAGWDAFHDLIWNDELSRGLSAGLNAGFSILTMASPPLINYGSDYLKNLVLPDVLSAKKFMSLAISEPYAGSDVANIRATAEKRDGHYIVNGQKKWITWAIHADFFTVAVRTGGPGMQGISLLLIPRSLPGVTLRRMKLQGQWLGGTCHVHFEDVRVPESHLIGQENHGFLYIMHNFNHERFVITIGALRGARTCLEEAIMWARKRKTFGKELIKHQVLRHKMANMAMQIESTFALVETIAYQINEGIDPQRLGSLVSLAKVQASRTYEFCAREASQIFGGSSYVREGAGQNVERHYREVRGTAIPGGSEEIMLDLAMKLARL